MTLIVLQAVFHLISIVTVIIAVDEKDDTALNGLETQTQGPGCCCDPTANAPQPSTLPTRAISGRIAPPQSGKSERAST